MSNAHLTLRQAQPQCHASASPSDAHGDKFLKAVNVGGSLPVCRGAPSQNISATKEGREKKRTNQLKDCTKSGLRLLRDRCRITSMRNLTMTLPPPPPPPTKQSLPLLPNYYRTLKPTSLTLKLKGSEVEGGGVCFSSGKKLHRRLRITPESKNKPISFLFCTRE